VLRALAAHSVNTIAVVRTAQDFISSDSFAPVVVWDISWPTDGCYEKIGSPDVLIHLAWDGLPNYKSLHHFETELPKQYAFLKAMVEGGLPSLLVTGTCFEYGMQEGCLSEDNVALPSNPYGFAKDALRRQLEFLQATIKFEMTWARLFYLYGEGQSGTSLYPQFQEAVQRGDRSFNMSSGEQLRDYLPVEELARLIVALAINKSGAGVINVCNGKPLSVRALVEKWKHENNCSIELNRGYYPCPDYEPTAFWGDRRKLDATLGVDL